jgi:hypothetical protein
LKTFKNSWPRLLEKQRVRLLGGEEFLKVFKRTDYNCIIDALHNRFFNKK